MLKVRSGGIVASNCKSSSKNHKIMISRFVRADLSRRIAPLLSCGDDLSGGSIRKPTPIYFLILLPFKTIIDIPIIISYIP
jgi:hypothetical protein